MSLSYFKINMRGFQRKCRVFGIVAMKDDLDHDYPQVITYPTRFIWLYNNFWPLQIEPESS